MTPAEMHTVINDFRSEFNGALGGMRREVTAFITDRDTKVEAQNKAISDQNVVLAEILTNVRQTNGKVAENVRTIELQRIEAAALSKRLDDHKAEVALKEATEKAKLEAKIEKDRAKSASDRRLIYAFGTFIAGAAMTLFAIYPEQIRAALTPASKEERVRVVDDRIQQWFPTQPSPKPTH